MVQVASMIGDGCFIAGTPITVATPIGVQERPVESLQPGETVMTVTGPLPIAAIAPRAAPPGPGAAIRLLPNALGPGLPRSALLVTPEQLLFIRDELLPDGALAPAGALVNGRSIQRVTRPDPSQWYAVTLETHGLLLAANLPAASQREPGGALSARLLPPGPALFALRGRLTRAAARAPAAAPDPAPEPMPAEPPPGAAPEPAAPPEPAREEYRPAADAPDLRLLADGAVVLSETEGPWRFIVPAGANRLRLQSPVGTPPHRSETDGDTRRFGVAVQSILLDGVPLDLGGMIGGEGFHALETREHQRWRWTDGNAELILPPCPRPRVLEVAISDWHKLLRRE